MRLDKDRCTLCVNDTASNCEQAPSIEKAPSIKQQRKQNRMARAALRFKSLITTMARKRINFDMACMHGNAYVQF